MVIVSIDPGSRLCGYSVLESKPLRYIEAGVLSSPAGKPRSVRIIEIGSDIRALLVEHRPEMIAIETAKWGGYPVAAGALGEVRGVILWIAAEARVPVTDFAPTEVRRIIGVGGAASKTTTAAHVKMVLGLRTAPHPDAADALAVGLAAAMTPPLARPRAK